MPRPAPSDLSWKAPLALIGSAGALLSPLLSWPMLVLSGLRRPLPSSWLLLWVGYALPLSLVDAGAGRWQDAAVVLLQASVGIAAAWLFVTRPRALKFGFLAALGVLALAAALEGEAYRQVWKSPGLNPRTAIEPSLLFGVDRVSEPATYRLWRRSEPSGALAMTLEVRSVGARGGDVAPVRASVAVDRVDRDSVLGGDRRHLLVTENWSEAVLTFSNQDLAALAEVRTTLHVQAGSAIEVRNVRFSEGATGANITPISAFPRQQLWYGHPNLLGHTAALGGLAFAVLPGALTITGLGVTLSLAVVLLAGSRAALAALLVGLLALLALRARETRAKAWCAIAATCMVGTLLVGGYVMVVGEARVNQGQAPRALIVETAIDAILSEPWSGLGFDPGAFGEFWRARNGGRMEPVRHAHNWWLQNGVSHGLPGLAAAVWLSVWLSAIAWRSGRWRGLVLVACVWLLQMADSTLLSWGALLPVTIVLNTLGWRAASANGGA